MDNSLVNKLMEVIVNYYQDDIDIIEANQSIGILLTILNEAFGNAQDAAESIIEATITEMVEVKPSDDDIF